MILDAFGEQAARVAGRIAGDATILACEPVHAAAALARALALRRAGTHFSLSIHFDDVRDGLMRERSAAFCRTYTSWDEVRLMLDDAAGAIAGAAPALTDAESSSLIEAIRLADGVIVRAWSEHARLLGALGTIPRGADIVVNPDPDVSAQVANERLAIVVYAPHSRADELGAFVISLGDLELPVVIIASDAPTIAGNVHFVLPADAAAALGRARVIVDASHDAGTALALAQLGRPLAVAVSSGAGELLRGVGTFDVWNRRSILAAVANALGMGPPAERTRAYDDRPPARAPLAFAPDAPLISVVVTTHNRPELLAITLATIEAQTYPHLEIVVVNDAGCDVSAVVAPVRRARLLDQPENRGPAAGRNRGLADARGTYVIFFDDDDEMFPDHIATLAHALLTSELDVAYGQMINALVRKTASGDYAIESLAGHVALLDHVDIQWAGALATTALLFRRTLPNTIGNVDETMIAAEDYDFWLRLAQGREWVRVADVTSLYFIRQDGSNRSTRNVARYLTAHRAIYEKHPAARPLVAAGRASMLEYFGNAR